MEHSKIVMPERGDELYKGLLEIFEDEDLLDVGLKDVEDHMTSIIISGMDYLDNLQPFDIVSTWDDFLSLSWVVVKTQPNRGDLEKRRTLELEKRIESIHTSPWEGTCNLPQRFVKCKELVKGLLSRTEDNCKVSTPVGRLGRASGISVRTIPVRVSDTLEGAIRQMQGAAEKVRDLESEIREKNEQLMVQKDSLEESKEKCRILENEKKKLNEKMDSKEFRDVVGQEYVKKVFEEYLKDADEMEQSLRKDWFNVLQGFCSIEGVPKEVKKMIQSLKRKPKDSDSMTVKAEAGSTINNYDIHGNDHVNTK